MLVQFSVLFLCSWMSPPNLCYIRLDMTFLWGHIYFIL